MTKQGVIESLKKNPENKELFLKWLDKRRAEIDVINTSKATLMLNVEIAEIYREAGLIDEALDAFEAAAEMAYQEGEEELYKKLLDELESLE